MSIKVAREGFEIVSMVPARGVEALLSDGDKETLVPIQAWITNNDGVIFGWAPWIGLAEDHQNFVRYRSNPCPCGTTFQYE